MSNLYQLGGTTYEMEEFERLMEECNTDELVKDNFIANEINTAVTHRVENTSKKMSRNQWVHIAIIALDSMIKKDAEKGFKVHNSKEDGRRKQFCSYLRRYLKLRMLDYIRKYSGEKLLDDRGISKVEYFDEYNYGRHNKSEIEEKVFDASREYISLEDIKDNPLMQSLLGKIDDRQLEILHYKYIEKLNQEEIAEATGVSRRTVIRDFEEINQAIKEV